MKKILTLIVIFFCSFNLYAQDIKYHDVNPDTTINYWEVFGAYGVDIWWHPSPEVVVRTWDPYEVLCGTDSLAKALSNGDDISATSSGIWAKQDYKCLNCYGTEGNWIGATDKYLGFRYKDTANQYHYGWIRLSIPAAATSFTIKDHAINNIGNDAVKAGQLFATGISQLNAGDNIIAVIEDRIVFFKGLSERVQVQVTDMAGRLIEKKRIEANERMDVSAYKTGLYVFSVYTERARKSFRILLN